MNPNKRKRFTKQEMIAWARYLSNGRRTEHQIESQFRQWFCGPNFKRPYPFAK